MPPIQKNSLHSWGLQKKKNSHIVTLKAALAIKSKLEKG